MKSMRFLCALWMGLVAAHGAFAAAPGAPQDLELGEVLVEGFRGDIHTLRRAVIEAENRFYSRYNDLNQIDEFDVVCREAAPTGTRLNKRSCRGVYVERAIEEEAREAFKIRQFVHSYGGSPPHMPASPPVPAATMIEARRPAFQRNMRALLQQSDELLLLLQERAAAIERYEVARRRVGEAVAEGL